MVSFCPRCGNRIESNDSLFCNKCGAKQPAANPEMHTPAIQPSYSRPAENPSHYIPPVQSPSSRSMDVPQKNSLEGESKKRSTGEWVAICCGGIILLFVISAFINGMTGFGASKSPSSTQLTIPQIKGQAQTVPYSSLMRNPENFKNKIVYFRGEIDQVQNVYGDKYMLRISTKQSTFSEMYLEDTLYVNYEGTRLLEGDIVDLWGRSVGLKTYTAVLGNEITIPEIDALHIEIYKAKE